MEAWTAKHGGECDIRNQADNEWKREVRKELTALSLEKAKQAGFQIGVATVCGLLSSGAAIVLQKFFGG